MLSTGSQFLPAEVLLELLLVLLLQRLHVLGHVETEDVLSVHVGVQLLTLGVVTGESLLGVGDVQSSVNSALQGSEHLRRKKGQSDT